MRPTLAALTFAAALAAAVLGPSAPEAEASPAMPRPLEQKIAEADLVVVARPKTRPVHPGDAYDVEVEQCLKGTAGKGLVRVEASYFFTGCTPPPTGTPRPTAIESTGDRYLLFLDAAKDGVRPSRDPVPLVAGGTASSWFYDSRPAELAPPAAAAIAALDAEADPVSAVKLWTAGLRGDNPLLVTALLHRLDFAATAGDYGRWHLGETLAAKAQAEFRLGRTDLVAAMAELAGSADAVVRQLTFGAATCAVRGRRDEEAASFVALAVRARESADKHDYVGAAARRLLCEMSDREAPAHLVAALRTAAGGQVPDLANLGRTLLRADPSREADLVAAVLPLLDDDAVRDTAVRFLSLVAGREFPDVSACRKWCRERVK